MYYLYGRINRGTGFVHCTESLLLEVSLYSYRRSGYFRRLSISAVLVLFCCQACIHLGILLGILLISTALSWTLRVA